MARYAKTSDEQIELMAAYRKKGATLQQIADKMGLAKGTVCKLLTAKGVKKTPVEI